jgi:hypothetical protein
MGVIQKLTATDTRWSQVEDAAQKWNRAIKSTLPSLQAKMGEGLLASLPEGFNQQEETNSAPLQEALISAIGNAASSGDWDQARQLAEKAHWTPKMLKQMDHARSAPPSLQTPMMQELFREVLNRLADQVQAERKADLQKTMPLDPTWEPLIDQYFDRLNQRGHP